MSLLIALIAAPAWAGQDDDLLDRAIKEKAATAPRQPGANEARQLRDQADQLAINKRFDDAIALYEKAYRLEPGNENGYTKMLIVKRAAGRLSGAEAEALSLIEENRKLKVQESIRVVQLDMLQAGSALEARDGDLALAKVEHARALIEQLPDNVDVSVYRNRLDKLAVRAMRMARADRGDAVNASDNEADDARGPVAEFERTLFAERDEPDGRVIRPDWYELDTYKDPYYQYQEDLAWSIKASHGDWYLGVEQARMTPRDEGLVYPADWAERSAKRAKYDAGEIYRSPSATGDDGQEYHTSIYDLGDLVHYVPDFYGGHDPDRNRHLQSLTDRDWIRRRSLMFAGYAPDLAAGIPVMQYYGGIDPWAVSPRTDAVELERVMRTIDTFLARQTSEQDNNK
jgi:tetratricopeptide (TPR) repeat protein